MCFRGAPAPPGAATTTTPSPTTPVVDVFVQCRAVVSTSPPLEDPHAVAVPAPRTRRLSVDQPAWLRVPPRPLRHHRRHPRRADPYPRLPRHHRRRRPTARVATPPRDPAQAPPGGDTGTPGPRRVAVARRWRASAASISNPRAVADMRFHAGFTIWRGVVVASTALQQVGRDHSPAADGEPARQRLQGHPTRRGASSRALAASGARLLWVSARCTGHSPTTPAQEMGPEPLRPRRSPGCLPLSARREPPLARGQAHAVVRDPTAGSRPTRTGAAACSNLASATEPARTARVPPRPPAPPMSHQPG